MSNSNFDKNGLDKSGTHWLQYAAFVVTAFVIYFGWAFFNDVNFHKYQLLARRRINPSNCILVFFHLTTFQMVSIN